MTQKLKYIDFTGNDVYNLPPIFHFKIFKGHELRLFLLFRNTPSTEVIFLSAFEKTSFSSGKVKLEKKKSVKISTLGLFDIQRAIKKGPRYKIFLSRRRIF